ncbi:alpha/beta hydrolase [Ornithinimicrobium panacihumi]|uniref:alpha/beta hydrolase n=1 Tax=Ornithinimicrobium panacihumi TaxID=2008449 RepID=UPI003F889365
MTHYRLLGQGEDPALVVPGGPLLDGRYLGDLGGLSAHRALAVLELPRVAVSEVAVLIEAARDELGLTTLDLVAHSAGAAAALCYLTRHPQRVRRLVLVTPAVGAAGIEADPEGIAAVLGGRKDEPGITEAVAARAADPTSLEAQRLWFGAWGSAQDQLARDSLVDRSQRLSTYYADPLPDPVSLQAAAEAFVGPVTVVRGEVDLHPTRRQAEALASLFDRAEVVTLPKAGHYPWLDDPRAFIDVVLAALGPDPSSLHG